MACRCNRRSYSLRSVGWRRLQEAKQLNTDECDTQTEDLFQGAFSAIGIEPMASRYQSFFIQLQSRALPAELSGDARLPMLQIHNSAGRQMLFLSIQ
ncbi:hypothetical protein O181_016838 [Austropuccinia psidii MF-1]|uniref:Uncharacterized protein n=1 Tax=Austropuccinia psidii MF-1 TaxID=1389203 RepID=A0A9Q3C559_9BASI|nr:hypothetical protein [Austropuccinia psidii MF-1]